MKTFIAGIIFSAAAWAQTPWSSRSFTLTGELNGGDTLQFRNLLVELYNSQTHAVMDRVQVASNGDFRFFNVTAGMYAVRVVAAPSEPPLLEEYRDINATSSPLLLRLPDSSEAKPVSGTISLNQLRHPVPKQALRAFAEALKFSEAKDGPRAIEKLELAIRLAPLYREAHGNLGVQYLRADRYPEAVAQLQRALEVGPPDSKIYVNLASAYFLMRDYTQGEDAAHKALALDPKNSRVHYLLGAVLAMQPGKELEALENLQAAYHDAPKARLLAAQVRVRMGDTQHARQDLADYLNSGAQENRAKVEMWLSRLTAPR
jgi:tetratricopeptide (TPR) repeat protein